ncbi:hypothetical protein PSENEW3_00000269 [Picochlorum sp. SENEW3]|nr:hypothetical protein PSENEW3_00000269 [Picochlorum sp. SENEW3]
MIVTLALFPLSIPLISGPVTGALILLLMSPAVILYSIHGNSVQHTIQIQDYVLTSVSSACVALYFLLVGSTILVTRLETYFDTFPWLTLWEKSTKKCPFTGSPVNRRCPSCGCHVSKDAFKTDDTLLELGGQHEILLWKSAKSILCIRNVDLGREKLDDIVSFTGNMATVSTASCCIGCSTWQKCFNLGRRLTMMYALAALFFAFLPWAFTTFSEIIGTAGIVLKIACGILGELFAASALLLEIKNMGKAAKFLLEHTSLPRPPCISAESQIMKLLCML